MDARCGEGTSELLVHASVVERARIINHERKRMTKHIIPFLGVILYAVIIALIFIVKQ